MWLDAGWQALAADAQWQSALVASVITGTAGTLLSLALSLWILSRVFATSAWPWSVRALPAMLALPHAAFAIGIVALLAPTGWLMRLAAPLFNWQEPPAWPTVQDPWGLSLVLVLVLKETPFLLWVCTSQLQRDDTGPRLTRELTLAYTLGHSPASAWWCVAVPQLLPRMKWPLLAVLAYALTVVDVAQVIGPGSPPTLSVLAWQWLQSPDARQMDQGTAAAWMLTLCLMIMAGLCWAVTQGGWPRWVRRWWTSGVVRAHTPTRPWPAVTALGLPYLAVVLALLVGSVTGVWRFPELWPQVMTLEAWSTVRSSPSVLFNTVSLAAVSAALSLLLAVVWLELLPPQWDARLRPVVYLPLVLPAVLWVVGMHGLALRMGLDNRWLGVLIAHSVAVMPYTLIALSPAYQGFDVRLWHTASSLGHERWRFLWRIKWPLLRAALWSAFAVGFAVSVAQYLPTLYVGGGRISTVTTEAVTLASGGQRSLSAAFAWLQWTLPALGFGLTAWLGRPRWNTV
ncbi:MAG: ABC transporter permease subunit [Burkholderiaceae bacterium]|nr:ABC transporter permease subunit [Burkholderiaceae bacterium]